MARPLAAGGEHHRVTRPSSVDDCRRMVEGQGRELLPSRSSTAPHRGSRVPALLPASARPLRRSPRRCAPAEPSHGRVGSCPLLFCRRVNKLLLLLWCIIRSGVVSASWACLTIYGVGGPLRFASCTAARSPFDVFLSRARCCALASFARLRARRSPSDFAFTPGRCSGFTDMGTMTNDDYMESEQPEQSSCVLSSQGAVDGFQARQSSTAKGKQGRSSSGSSQPRLCLHECSAIHLTQSDCREFAAVCASSLVPFLLPSSQVRCSSCAAVLHRSLLPPVPAQPNPTPLRSALAEVSNYPSTAGSAPSAAPVHAPRPVSRPTADRRFDEH